MAIKINFVCVPGAMFAKGKRAGAIFNWGKSNWIFHAINCAITQRSRRAREINFSLRFRLEKLTMPRNTVFVMHFLILLRIGRLNNKQSFGIRFQRFYRRPSFSVLKFKTVPYKKI